MSEIDKWFADKCGIRCDDAFDTIYYDGINGLGDEWTIQDPRCREVIREQYQLTTDIRQDGSRYCYPRLNIDDAIRYMGNGGTIAEAEIACLKAIYENSNEL